VLAARLFGAASAGLRGDVAALDGDDGWVERLKEAVRLAARNAQRSSQVRVPHVGQSHPMVTKWPVSWTLAGGIRWRHTGQS
jgi:hypothetical protein